MTDKPKSIAELADDVAEATKAYENAVQEVRSAQKQQTSALNRLNEAQKAFSKQIDEFMSHAPTDTDWKRHNISRGEA